MLRRFPHALFAAFVITLWAILVCVLPARAQEAAAIVNQNVKVIPAASGTAKSMRSAVSGTRIVGKTGNALALLGVASGYKAGDVIISGEGEGLLRKVMAVQSVGAQTILQTQDAALTDLFRRADIKLQKQLSLADFQNVQSLYPGVSIGKPENAPRSNRGVTFSAIPVHFANVTFAVSNGGSMATVQLNGEATFSPSFDFDLQIRETPLPTVTKARFVPQMKSTLSVAVSASAKVNILKKSFRLFTFPGKPFTVPVGVPPLVIPVTITPIFHVDAVLEGSLEKKAALKFEVSSSLAAGIDYNQARGVSGICNVSPPIAKLSGDVNVSAELAFTPLHPELNLKIFGQDELGPYLEFDVPKLSASITASATETKILGKATFSGTAGFRAKLLGKLPFIS